MRLTALSSNFFLVHGHLIPHFLFNPAKAPAPTPTPPPQLLQVNPCSHRKLRLLSTPRHQTTPAESRRYIQQHQANPNNQLTETQKNIHIKDWKKQQQPCPALSSASSPLASLSSPTQPRRHPPPHSSTPCPRPNPSPTSSSSSSQPSSCQRTPPPPYTSPPFATSPPPRRPTRRPTSASWAALAPGKRAQCSRLAPTPVAAVI